MSRSWRVEAALADQHVVADRRVRPHQGDLRRVEPPGLVDDGVGDVGLADVVDQGRL